MRELENRLLILLSNIRISEKETDEIISILKTQSIDWRYVIDMSRVQGINGTIYYHTQLLRDYFPRQIILQYKYFNKEIISIESGQYDEYKKIFPDFIKNNIQPVILKGFSFSKYFYRLPGIRVSKDLDILIPTDRLTLAGTILESYGYIEKCDVESPKHHIEASLTGKYNKDSIYLTSAHGYSKHVNEKNNMFIELHHTSFYFGGLDLTFLYNNRIISDDGILHLDSIDMFVFSCVHFWQHYRGKMDTAALTLRCFSDIKEMYHLVEEQNKINELLNRCENYGLHELVCQIVSMVKYLVGGQYDQRLLSEEILTTYENKYFKINTLEPKYFFDKHKLASDLNDKYSNLSESIKPLSTIIVEYYENSIEEFWNDTVDNDMEFFSSSGHSRFLFFTSHISSKFSLNCCETNIGFAFRWNHNELFLYVKYSGKHKYSMDTDNIHFACSYLKLKLFDGNNIEVYYIQPNVDRACNLYRADSDINEIMASTGSVYLKQYLYYFECAVSIPWQELKHSPTNDERIRFDIAGCYFDNDDLRKQYEMNFSEGNGYSGEYDFSNKYIRLKANGEMT